MKKYDVAIIGGGIGGLAAGARLAAAQYKVIILEKQSILGGRYTAADYKGYRITTAAYYIVHPNGPVIQLLKDIDVESELEIAPAPDPYLKYRIDGKDIPVPKKGGTLALLPYVAQPEEVERIQTAFRRAIRWSEPSDEIALKDWLSQYTDNEKVHQIFNMMCLGTSGATSSILPAGEFIRILKNYGKYGGSWVIPKGHLKPLVDSIVDAIKFKGGEIQTEAKVKKILAEKQLVKGVLVEKEGKEMEFESQVVISDCSPHDMITMVGEENFDKGYIKQIQGMETPECFNIIWNCDKPAFDWPGVINFPQCESPFYAVDFSLIWRNLVPEGKYSVWAGFTLPQGSYDIKKEIERGIKQCKENFPVLEECGKVLMVQVFRKNWPLLWATCGHDLPQKTPVENLYLVGDAAKPPGLTMAEGVVEGARLVVEDIKRRIKPL